MHTLLRRQRHYWSIIFRFYIFLILFISVNPFTSMKCIKCQTETKNQKFCSRKCSTSWNNKLNPRRKLKPTNCYKCGILIKRTNYSDRRKVCSDCNRNSVDWSKVTYKTMRCQRAYQKNSRIRELARRLYSQSGKPKFCSVCGYDKHIEICHKNPISSHKPDSLISTINHIDNLIALCPNHHWEFDNGQLHI